MSNLSIIIPTKNEEESLIVLLEELKKYREIVSEIIIVDANSTDKTLDVANNHKCRIISQGERSGYGDAIVQGINISSFEFSLILDGDGSKNPQYIIDLFKKIKDTDFDFIFAERYGKGAGSLDDTLLTFVGNRIFTYLGKIFFNIKVNDILHTFFICKNLSFKKMSFNHFNFGFCVELPIMVHKYKLKYGTLPTTERKRIAGEVKVKSFKDGIKILKSMIVLFFTTLGKKY